MENLIVEISEKYNIKKETAKVLITTNKKSGNDYDNAKIVIKYFFNIVDSNIL